MNTTTTKIAGEAMTDAEMNELVIRTAREGGLRVIMDSKMLNDNYTNVTGSFPSLVRFARALLASQAAVPEGWVLVPDHENTDAIVTSLYRRFKDWSKRGFGPDDVTWCEVKADVQALLAASPTAPAQSCGDAEQADEAVTKSVRCQRGGGSCSVASCIDEGACTMQRVTDDPRAKDSK